MEFLELQLFEPISFRFHALLVSYTGGSVLTCIAVLAAAAVGFWRIRTVGSKDDASVLFTASTEESVHAQQKVVSVIQSTTETTTKASLAPSCYVDRTVENIVGSPKVRFTTYFKEDDFIGCCHVEDDVEQEEPIVEAVEELFGHELEVQLSQKREEQEMEWDSCMVIRRRGDLGWYSYQDMAALNGSVVRLWEGDSPRKIRKASIAISSF